MDIEKIAKAIEADAGEPLPELRQALREARDIRAGKATGRVTTPEQLLVRAARAKLGLSQTEFAARIGTPAATLRDWEQGRFSPPGAAVCLLRLLVAHPKLSEELAAA
jgi:putative transcriptional regulator